MAPQTEERVAFSRGDRVIDPDDPNLTAVIVDGPQAIGLQRFYLVRNQSGEEGFFSESDLAPPAIQAEGPVAWLTGQSLGDPDHMARLVTNLKLTSSLTDIIYSLSSTRTLFRVHQFKPVLKLIESSSQRLLLADEVGLGKTIEAGLIWAEIDARSPTRRVLVVCPSGLRTKWQIEMRRRFDREMEIVDRNRLKEIFHLYEERGDASRFFAIASYNTLRSDDVLESLANRPPTFDLVIVDEAHAMRNSETKTHQVGELLAQNSVALLLLSATPVNLGSSDLFNLLRLIQPDQFTDLAVFNRALAPNEHITAAMRALTSDPEPDGAEVARLLRRVEETSEAPRFLRNPIYVLVLHRLQDGRALLPSDVNTCAQHLSGLNTIASVYNRTRKRDLTDHQAVRRARTAEVELTETEQLIYSQTLRLVNRLRGRVTGVGPGLAAIMPARQASSCLPVMADYVEELLTSGRLEADFAEGEEDDDELIGDEALAVDVDRALAKELIVSCRRLHGADSKLTSLVEHLKDLRVEGSGQALIFSFFRRTLAYLGGQLTQSGFRCQVMTGQTPMRDRDGILDRFRAGEIEILLCSEIGSEGLDFEFCNVVVNYDLPWNPMRLEQRIGRVDRFGQRHDVIHVVNFEVPGTIDTEIFLRLYTRIGVFEQSIGELEPILGEQLQELNRGLAASDLTVEEQEKLANRIALAVEGERQELNRFEVNRERLVGVDAYVSGSLEQAYAEKRYMTPEELCRYVDGFAREECSPARLTGDGPVLALTGSTALADHLRQYGRRWSTPEFSDFITRLETGGPIPVTFDSESAYHREAEFVHARHAIVRSITEFYSQNAGHLPLGGYVRLSDRSHEGSWIFFVYRLTAGGLRPTRKFLAAAYRLGDGSVDFDIGRTILTFLAGEGPARMQQRHLPIIERGVVQRAFEASQAAIVVHCATAQVDLQRCNDALIAVRQEALRSGLEVRRNRLEEFIQRPGLNERIRRMRIAQISNLEKRTADELGELEQHWQVRVGFNVIAAGIADFV
jgi:superfamily II DNA or RNA helicase